MSESISVIRRVALHLQVTLQIVIALFSTRPQPLGPDVTSNRDQAIPSSSRLQGATRQLKTFNLNTYKFHALGDYTATIRRYGTTDSYSTEAVCSSYSHTEDVSENCTG
jgi:hypothetical protein